MNSYRRSLLITALIISIPSFLFVLVGIMSLHVFQLIFWGGMLLLWWGAYTYLRQGSKRAYWLSFCLVNLFWWPLLWLSFNRVMFIVENGGMDLAGGAGSPLAFLIGFIVEQLFFLPLCFSMVFGVRVIRGFKRSV